MTGEGGGELGVGEGGEGRGNLSETHPSHLPNFPKEVRKVRTDEVGDHRPEEIRGTCGWSELVWGRWRLEMCGQREGVVC